jgi:hypothetical protein
LSFCCSQVASRATLIGFNIKYSVLLASALQSVGQPAKIIMALKQACQLMSLRL